MMPAIQYSISNVSILPGTTFTRKKNYTSTRFTFSRKHNKKISLSSQKFLLPLSTSIRLFPQCSRIYSLHHGSRIPIVSATGTDLAVKESDPPITTGDSGETSKVNDDSPIKSDPQSKRSRPVRKSEMPPVKNEELVTGATFTGKIRSIQPFGAFIDFGAFTDGLVHVSQLSDGYVKDVASFVLVGQEVKVRLLDANFETGRISLTMRENDDTSKGQQRRDSPASSSAKPGGSGRRSGPQKLGPRKDEVRKSSKFVKGQDLQGTVKNLGRAGAFISLPEEEEGFLPHSEEVDEGFANIMGGTSLEVGQEVSVRVLRITRGQVTLTMKKEEDVEKLDSKLSQGTVHTATNPFALAFRQNKDVAAFLDEKEQVEKEAKKTVVEKITEIVESTGDHSQTESDLSEAKDGSIVSDDSETPTLEKEADSSLESKPSESIDSSEKIVDGIADAIEKKEQETKVQEENVSASMPIIEETEKTDAIEDDGKPDISDGPESIDSSGTILDGVAEAVKKEEESEVCGDVSAAVETIKEGERTDAIENEGKLDASDGPESVDNAGTIVHGIAAAVEKEEESEVSGDVSAATGTIKEGEQADAVENEGKLDTSDEVASSENSVGQEPVIIQDGGDFDKDRIQSETPAEENQTVSAAPVQEEVVVPETDKNGSIVGSGGLESEGDSDLSKDSSNEQTPLSSENKVLEEVDSQAENNIKDEVQIEAPTTEIEVPSSSTINDEKPEPNPKNNSSGISPNENAPKASISPALVKQLREETGAGMMDCKKALSESGGDIVKAQEFLRKKGLASADKKASRVTAEGRIGSYIHDGRIGILVEVNCETDFVSRGEIFKELVDDIAMQAAACPQVKYLVTEDVPVDIVLKEKEIEMQKEDLLSKPEQIRETIVEGRIRKRLEELALLEQPYIKNDKVVVKDLVKQTIATIGENIKVKRFMRFNLGEGLVKKSQDFAAEVAAQTAAKSNLEPTKEQPAVPEAKETVEKPPSIAISAALVKQLREETGAGMMDCKKALSETGGDLEKAQEYLRKKGLSAADKKSTRIAAEGRIGSYIHDSRIGVLVEVNCETDFVGRNEKFKELVDDLAMQVVACPQVRFVSIEEVPETVVAKEKEIEMQREDLKLKPESIREKIVDGRISKRLGELALLEQPFIKNDTILVKDLVKQTVAALGENIKVRRFARFTLGETSEDAKPESEA